MEVRLKEVKVDKYIVHMEIILAQILQLKVGLLNFFVFELHYTPEV